MNEIGEHEFKISGQFFEGIELGESIAEETARIAAFGAIRRAAEVARALDKAADRSSFEDSYEFIDMAKGARAAIRAAIGSDKT